MIMPGGMIAPRTSCALSRRLTKAAGRVMPAANMSNVNNAIVTSPSSSCPVTPMHRRSLPCSDQYRIIGAISAFNDAQRDVS